MYWRQKATLRNGKSSLSTVDTIFSVVAKHQLRRMTLAQVDCKGRKGLVLDTHCTQDPSSSAVGHIQHQHCAGPGRQTQSTGHWCLRMPHDQLQGSPKKEGPQPHEPQLPCIMAAAGHTFRADPSWSHPGFSQFPKNTGQPVGVN